MGNRLAILAKSDAQTLEIWILWQSRVTAVSYCHRPQRRSPGRAYKPCIHSHLGMWECFSSFSNQCFLLNRAKLSLKQEDYFISSVCSIPQQLKSMLTFSDSSGREVHELKIHFLHRNVVPRLQYCTRRH